MALLSWKKDVIAMGYDLFIDGNIVGEIRNERLSSNSYVKVNGRKYFFESEGLSQKTINVIDMNSRKQIGKIVFNFWRNKASIALFDKEFMWKSDNFFYRKWSIYSTANNPLIRSKLYKGDSHKVNNRVEELLLFCGIVTLVRRRNNG
ncbi:MAG: hypothetical protein RIE52_10135 [Balneola sp.]|jgi:hypothetical protein